MENDMIKTCENCGKEFLDRNSINIKFTKRFCSRNCQVATSRRKARSDGRCDINKWKKENPEKQKASIMKNYKNNKTKWNSRAITNQLIKKLSIEIIYECKECKSINLLEIHHEIYPTKKKDIQEAIKDGKIYYLCKKCHGKKRHGIKNKQQDIIDLPIYKTQQQIKIKPRKFGKYGNTDVIKLKPQDKIDNEWEYGDDIDVEKCKKIKK